MGRVVRGLDSGVCRCAGWRGSVVVWREEDNASDDVRCVEVFVDVCDTDGRVFLPCLELLASLVLLLE